MEPSDDQDAAAIADTTTTIEPDAEAGSALAVSDDNILSEVSLSGQDDNAIPQPEATEPELLPQVSAPPLARPRPPQQSPPQRLTLEEMKARDKKQITRFAIIIALFVIGIAAAVSGVIVGLDDDKDNNSSSGSATMAPTPVPTTPDNKKCFTSLENLRQAIRYYRLDPDNATLAEEYGAPIGTWCITPLTTLRQLLDGISTFNFDISGWDTSNVVDMSSAFAGAEAFNQPLNNWETSKVTDFSYMFYDCLVYNQPMNDWNTESALSMASMFTTAEAFNQELPWNVTRVESFTSMFSGAIRFNQDLSSWAIGSATTSTRSMFNGASRFYQNLCAWGDRLNATTAVSDMFLDTKCAFGSDADLLATPDLTANPPGPFCYPCS